MKLVIVYESMFGNARRVAESIARGLGPQSHTVVVPVTTAQAGLLDGAGLVVVGGPTHAHALSRAGTRKGAASMAGKPGSELTLERGADGRGLREWLARQHQGGLRAAAFDTRLDRLAVLTGRASKGIGRLLRRHGGTPATGRRRGSRTGRGRELARRLAAMTPAAP